MNRTLFSGYQFALAWAISTAVLPGQTSPNTVTVAVSQNLAVQINQSSFSVSVSSGFNKSLNEVVGAVSSVGITAANLVSLGGQPSALTWVFQLTVPTSQQTAVTNSLIALESTIGQNNSGLTLSFGVTGTQTAGQPAQSCDLAALVASARTQAQSMANAAGLSAGAIVAIASAALNSPAPTCSMSVSFGLGATSWQPSLNTITTAAAQIASVTPDQAVVSISVASGPVSGLDDVMAVLEGAGVAGATFEGVNTTPVFIFPTYQTGLTWSFQMTVPLTKLGSTMTQLSTAQQTLQQQNNGFGMSFGVLGLSSSQTQALSCPNASLVAAAQSQAQQVATAASLSLGPILAISGGQNVSGNGAPLLTAGSTYTGTSFAELTAGTPVTGTSGLCSVTVQFQLLY